MHNFYIFEAKIFKNLGQLLGQLYGIEITMDFNVKKCLLMFLFGIL